MNKLWWPFRKKREDLKLPPLLYIKYPVVGHNYADLMMGVASEYVWSSKVEASSCNLLAILPSTLNYSRNYLPDMPPIAFYLCHKISWLRCNMKWDPRDLIDTNLEAKHVVYIYSTCWRCIRRCLCRRYNTVSKQTVRVTSVMFPSSAEKLLNHSWSFGLAFGKLSTNFTYNQPLRHSQTQETQPFTTFNKKNSKATDG